jgi:hypothetical protein
MGLDENRDVNYTVNGHLKQVVKGRNPKVYKSESMSEVIPWLR